MGILKSVINKLTDINMHDYESSMRKMVNSSRDENYNALSSLEEARRVSNAYLIMQGDEGGQIYLVAPIFLVKCDYVVLENLLKSLDELAWNDISMADIYFETYDVGEIVVGGMGGGVAGKDVWLHKDFDNIKNLVIKVLNGNAKSISQ